jgi:hypothetical protein
MQIIAAPGALVRDPVTNRVVSENVPLTVDPLDVHWARLLLDRDVLPAPSDDPAPPAQPAIAPAASSDSAEEPEA